MSHTKELLLLHLSHAKQALEKAKNNSYSDQRKEKYQASLFELFDSVENDTATNLNSYTDQQIYDGPKKHLDFIIKSLQFLDSSTFNQIPYEIVECLKNAMEDWEKTDEFIIVTSLINDQKQFSYEGWLATDKTLYADISAKYPSIKFDHRLVQINLPKALSRDYLVAVVLYHELGHFIDRKNSITESLLLSILDRIYQGLFSATDLLELKKYLPTLTFYIDMPTKLPWAALPADLFSSPLRHVMEYFADMFAAQYVGNMSELYVTYLSDNKNSVSNTHPSTLNRRAVVSDFLSGNPNFIVNEIQESVKKIKSKPLEKRFDNVADTDFFNLVPTELKTVAEMHGILHRGWTIWLDYQHVLASSLKSPTKIYAVINNLIEKSIGNYISTKEWERVKPVVTGSTAIADQTTPLKENEIKAILTKAQVKKLIDDEKLYIRPLLDPDQIGEAGIDFRLGYDFLVSVQGRDAFINASRNDWVNGGQRRNIKQFFQSSRRQLGETFILHPHQTVLAVTLEYVRLPDNCVLMLFMRSSYARLGLTISTIAQPGYCGCLSLEFTNTNNNPINLAVGARIIQGILFPVGGSTHYLHTPRKYVCHVRPEPSAVIDDKDLTLLNDLWKQNNAR